MSRLKYIKFNVQPCPQVWQKLVFPPLPSFQILPTLPFFLIQIKLAYNTTLHKKRKKKGKKGSNYWDETPNSQFPF